ncbi:MAG: hypothetical protein Q8R02_07610 [Hyphomonadaceae bacterium]|nr:hypothetical protein [Hyphomonadaceae bacterium]
MRVLLLVGAIALAAACTDEGAGPTDPSQATATPADQQAQVASAGPQATNAEINWDAARADFAKRPADQQNATVQAAGQEGPAPVPMLLPSGIVQTQSDRPVPPVVTKDGYFATYHLAKYDAIVNGSQRSYAAAGQAQGNKEEMKFTPGEASAQLSFSRYGADYLIEFECREADGADSCITEPEAKEFADSLFVAQTR